jgi:hypothetical protein
MATGSRSLAARVILSTKAALARCNAVGETWSPSLPIGATGSRSICALRIALIVRAVWSRERRPNRLPRQNFPGLFNRS